jgi:hypothetical protein
MDGTGPASLAGFGSDDTVIQIYLADHRLNHIQQAQFFRGHRQTQSAFGTLHDFDKSGSGKLLRNFTQELIRDVHFRGDLFAVADNACSSGCQV